MRYLFGVNKKIKEEDIMLTGSELVEYAKSKVDTPYFYGCLMEALTNEKAISLANSFPSIVTPNYLAKAIVKGQIGKINTDDAGLIYGYTKKKLSAPQLYYTAKARLNIDYSSDWADGVIVWRMGHVGVFYHNLNNEPIVIEAKDINYGTVFSIFNPSKWKKGLVFDWMEYSYNKSASNEAIYKGHNPYSKPSSILRIGSKGEAVKWLQFELMESGYDLSSFECTDGIFGPGTCSCVRQFQKDTYLPITGKVNQDTINALTINKGGTE